MKNQKFGFTLIELSVTATIILVLSGVILANYEKSKIKSRDTQRKSNLSRYAQALQGYWVDNKAYPCSNATCVTPPVVPSIVDISASVESGLTTSKYLDQALHDPKSDGVMKYMSDKNNFKVYVNSETIKAGDGSACTDAAIKSKAGDFCDPASITRLQVSSSNTAAQWTEN